MSKLKMKRFPGDTIVVPMLIGVVLNSFVPQVLQIGGFFTGMVTGTSALVGVFLLFMGATIDIKSTPKAIKKGAVIIITKIVLSIIIYRPFCRYICPLGAFYSVFNKVSIYRYRVDMKKCVHCGKCAKACQMVVNPVENPNSPECIRCGRCKQACPVHAIASGCKR